MGIIISLVFCAITAFLAKRKGYNPILWFFAGGILGLLILAFLPFTNKGNLSEEERIKKLKSGNIIGGVIAAIAITFILLQIFILAPAQEVGFKKIAKEAKKAVCEAQAGKIILALDKYMMWHYGNYDEGPHRPDSLDNSEFKDRFLDGKLPEHPLGWNWNDYYNPDEPMVSKGGKLQGPIDIDNACNF